MHRSLAFWVELSALCEYHAAYVGKPAEARKQVFRDGGGGSRERAPRRSGAVV